MVHRAARVRRDWQHSTPYAAEARGAEAATFVRERDESLLVAPLTVEASSAEQAAVQVSLELVAHECRLEGQWIDIADGMTVEELQEEVHAMLARCSTETHTAEEFAIHDHENFMGCKIDEYDSLESVVRLATFLSEYGEPAAAAMQLERDIDRAEELLRDGYAGRGESLSDWASAFLEETGALDEMPEQWRQYIDIERYASDLELGGEIATTTVEGTVHVFWTR
jgi:antirestriction protein